jgi:energy-coupling factor transporter ATP-binding protein EcfA2
MMSQDVLPARNELVIVLCPDVGDDNFITSAQFAHIIPAHTTSLITVCSWISCAYPQLTVQETIQLTTSLGGVQQQEARQRALVRMLPLDMKRKVDDLSALQRRYLALLVALAPAPDCAVLFEPTQGLGREATHNWRRVLRGVRTLVDTPMMYVTADLETTHILSPDEVRWFQDGQYRQAWPANALPAIFRRGAAYHFTFCDAQTAIDFQKKVQGHAPDFGVLSCERVELTQAAIIVDAPSRLLGLTLLGAQGVVRVDRAPLNLKTLGAPILAQVFDLEGLLSTRNLEHSVTRRSAFPHRSRVQCQGIWYWGMAEWRRHFRTLWRIGNILLSNILLLGFLSMVLQVLQQGPMRLAANLMALTLFAAAGLAMGWGVVNVGRFVREGTIALGFLAGVGIATFWSGLLWGQLLILITHALPLGVLWLIIFSHAGILLLSFLYFLFTLLGVLALTILATLLVTGQTARLGVGWGIYVMTLFVVAITPQIPAHWQLSLAVWPFTGLTLAFVEMATTSAHVNNAPAAGWLALAGLVCLWAVTSVTWMRKRRQLRG